MKLRIQMNKQHPRVSVTLLSQWRGVLGGAGLAASYFWYLCSKCGPWTSSISISWTLVKNVSRSSGPSQGPLSQNLHFNSIPRSFVGTVKGKKPLVCHPLGDPFLEHQLLFITSLPSPQLVCCQPGQGRLFGRALRDTEIMASY